jgi:hypothetical protein
MDNKKQHNTDEIEQIPAWKLLDEITRKWAVMSGMEKDLENYEKRKIIYQD